MGVARKQGVHFEFHFILKKMAKCRAWRTGETWGITPDGQRILLFYGNSAFSNFTRVSIFIDGEDYNSVEMFYQHKKAKYFGDEVTAAKVLRECRPWVLNKLTRKIRGFNKKEWNAVKDSIMFEGCKAKYCQNKYFRDQLRETGLAILAEATPYCRYWGIGLHRRDPDALDPRNWTGTNRFGRMLMQIRDQL